jgi:hypothetical protein
MFPKSQSALRYITKFGHGATGWLALSVSGGGVTSFPGRLRDGLPFGRDPQGGLALTSNGDVFDATGMAAISANSGNRAGYFIGIHPPVGRCFREIPRLAIGMGGMGATFVAPGQALVHAVPVGLVGDDEYAAVGQCRRTGEERKSGQKRRNGSHECTGA